MALRPVADAAGYADGLEGAGVRHVEPVGVDEVLGVAHLAAEPDRIAPDGRVEGPSGLRDVAREAQVPHAVGRLGKLAQEAPGRLEGLVDVPQGTGAAETRELEPRGRVALGDRARLIDADEEEGNAL